MYIIAGTGSRSYAGQLDKKLDQYIRFQLGVHGSELRLMSGMAEGWDEAIARIAIANNIAFITVIPNKGYGQYYWGSHSTTGRNRMAEFNDYLAKAAEVVYVSTTLYVNGQHSNFVRNQYMVDHADEFVVFNPTSPGTRDCVARIQAVQKPYHIIK